MHYVLIILSFLLLFPSCVHSQSAVPVASVRVEPQANYERLKGGKDPNKLIDGKLASGSLFWLDANALGWQKHGEVSIDLELAKASRICTIALNTAKNESANVFLPLSVSIFTSQDGKSYSYAGDMAMHDETKGYRQVELKSPCLGIQAKFVRLVVVPRGSMFFTDEIRISGGGKSTAAARSARLSRSDMTAIIAKNKQTAINRLQLIEELDRAPKSNQAAWKALRQEILQASNLHSGDQLKQYQEKITRLNLVKGAGEKLIVQFSPDAKAASIKNAVGTTHYQRIEAQNNSGDARSVKIVFTEQGSTSTQLYEVQGVRSRTSAVVQDVLMPVAPGQSVRFNPGERKSFLLGVKSVKAGTSPVALQFGSERLSLSVQSVDIGINSAFRKKTDLQVNVWPYYSTPFYQGREVAVRKDLLDHYVNIFAIPAWTLEPLNAKTDHRKLKDYMRLYNRGDKVLLFLNHSSYMANPGDYLKDSWKKRYLTWHDKVMKILKDSGVASDKIYLYPFDEVEEKEIASFNHFSKWIRQARPGSQIYLTVVEQHNLSKVQGQADIIQLLVTKNQIEKVKAMPRQQYWIYDIMDDSKVTDPDLRYRAMAWNAYKANATGIGFWNYADVFGKSVWDDTDGPKSDYHAVYDRPGGVIPSRRWEAFKQGVEEYYILKRYEEKHGRAATLKLIGSGRITAAGQMDKARALMLDRLSGKR